MRPKRLNPKSEHRVPVRIHLLWAGPHTFGDVLGMKDPGDYGIYQVCGPHSASAAESLLYIGQANGQTFGERFTGPDRQEWCPDGWGDNTVLFRYFVGRVLPTQDEQQRGTIDDDRWATCIDLAETLLIYVHAPHWNSQGINALTTERSADYDDIHVFNWGTRASLLPEVSGARHTETLFEQLSADPLEYKAR